jgi:hypothetical protein
VHSFDDTDLLPMYVDFTLSHSKTVQDEVIKELRTSSPTPLVKALQMLRLQRAIFATGMFSLFESVLQSQTGWDQPFTRLKEYLEQSSHRELAERFSDYQSAINVLKHGTGRSYRQLLGKASKLEFKIKPEGEPFFYEGDVSEVDVLIDVDEQFVRRCAALIREVSSIMRSRTKNPAY